jgi:Cdc6-like AAA superfamily ATPase
MARAARTDLDWVTLEWEVGSLFSGAPVAEEELFAGRTPEVSRMIEAVLENGKHVILFGERGVGKTSIGNVFWKRYNKSLQTVVTARVQADPSDSFSSLWINALDELKATANGTGKADLVPINTEFEQITPVIIRRELQKCRPNAIPIIIIDEFDKLQDDSARELTAHVIKALYDDAATVNTTVIIVGVAEDIRELIEDHKSLTRALTEIKMERMTPHELNEVLDKRLRRTPLTISGDARWTVVMLSRGMPYYVQMLGKYASLNAVRRKKLKIETQDVDAAMDRLLKDSGQSFQDDYQQATQSNQTDNLFKQVLLGCALAKTDEYGFFTPTNVIEPLNSILHERRRHAHFDRHLREFITERRGNVLIRRGDERQYRFRFSDPMMQPYVIIKGIRDGMIDDDTRKRLLYREQPSLPNV